MTTLILVGIILPVLLLGALCVWLAVRLQRAERELEGYRAVDRLMSALRDEDCQRDG